MKTNIEIARAANMQPILEISESLGIPSSDVHQYGRWKAKVSLEHAKAAPHSSKLILVTAMTPTHAGEGKTTTTIGLGDGLRRIGKQAMICLREPSLGPCFGMKGGAAGGGFAQVVPMEDINLHFTGDFHAVTSANNLLAAMIDNHVFWGNRLGLDARRISWRRTLDMNDRALRQIVTSLGGVGNGYPRENGFDITAASEVMAILCLAENLEDLQRRLGRIVVGQTRERDLVTAEELEAAGAMTVLLRDALMPNLVQTLENTPALVHGGPFANIAHGCNSVIATRAALNLADYVVTEAGFGADLGAEKFFDIKCRKAGLKPSVAVIVASIRALKMHGGVAVEDLERENVAAVEAGFANLARHVRNVGHFGVPAIVAVNAFASDSDAEFNAVAAHCRGLGVEAVNCTHYLNGGVGTEELAQKVVALAETGHPQFRTLYADEMPLWDKVQSVCRSIYGADEAISDHSVRDQLNRFEELGYGHYPICMAKTQYSFSADPTLKGAPGGFVVPVREVRLAAGAEFVVLFAGEMLTMPGLPQTPTANRIGFGAAGDVVGLF